MTTLAELKRDIHEHQASRIAYAIADLLDATIRGTPQLPEKFNDLKRVIAEVLDEID